MPLFIDNSTALGALGRQWSKAPHLQDLLEEIQRLATAHDFVLEPRWIASADNVLSDALSRHDMPRFWTAVTDMGVAAAAQASPLERC